MTRKVCSVLLDMQCNWSALPRMVIFPSLLLLIPLLSRVTADRSRSVRFWSLIARLCRSIRGDHDDVRFWVVQDRDPKSLPNCVLVAHT